MTVYALLLLISAYNNEVTTSYQLVALLTPPACMERVMSYEFVLPARRHNKMPKKPVHPMFSDEDSDLRYAGWTNTNGYATTGRVVDGQDQRFYAHRIVLARKLGRPLVGKEEVDHEDRNNLNCKRDNIRLATRSQNNANRPSSRKNRNGLKGAYQSPNRTYWKAAIGINGKGVHIGTFKTEQEAHEAYMKRAKEVHGEFAFQGAK